MKFTIRDLLLVTMLVALAAFKPIRAAEYASPADVFTAFQKGWKEKDGETVLGCLTEDYRGEVLLSEWGREYSIRFPGPRIERIVSKHVNEKLRAELTRQELPTTHREFISAMSRCLDDTKATFVDLVAHLDEVSRREYTAGVVADFSTDDKRAEALLKYKDDPTRYVCHFVKQERGWLYAGLTSSRDGMREERAPTKAVPARPWTNGPVAKYATPQEAFSALLKALKENDPETAWNCFTDERRNRVLAFFASGVMEGDKDWFHVWYLDMDKWLAGMFGESNDRGSTDELLDHANQVISEAIREPKVLCSAVVKAVAGKMAAIAEKERHLPELRNVVEKGDEAKGVLVFPPNPHGMNVVFRKSMGGWRLELPPMNQLIEKK